MYFIEQVERFLAARDGTAIVIGDYDKTTSAKSVIDLAFFKAHSTKWARGVKIERIVDCVHYVQSHHSRLIQMADHFIWSTQMVFSPDKDQYPRKRYREVLNDSRLAYTPWCRQWPSEPYWYR
jgi:hypothetical protein